MQTGQLEDEPNIASVASVYQASLVFPGVGSYQQSIAQGNVIAATDSCFGMAFAVELVINLAVHSPRRYYHDRQSVAEFLVVMLFGLQTGIESSGGSLPFPPFLLRLIRMVSASLVA